MKLESIEQLEDTKYLNMYKLNSLIRLETLKIILW